MPTIIRGARVSNISGPPAPTGIDLIVTNIAWTGTPVSGDQVIFRATVQNIGDTATPGGTILDVAFFVDGGVSDSLITWSDTDTTSLAAGASRTLTANSGPLGNAYWSATIGTHTVLADVNSIDRITESNGTNNTYETSITIAAGTGAPELPANAVVGTPASELVWWGDGVSVYQSQATFQLWYGRGWHGWRFGANQLYGHTQFDTDFKPSSAAGLGSVYSWQQQLEPSGGNRAALANAVGHRIWNGIYFREVPFSSNLPPVDWWSDAAWDSFLDVAERWQQAADYLGLEGNSIDTEINGNAWLADGYQGDTHTEAQNRAKVEQRGYETALRIWGTNPATSVVWYDLLLPGGWNNKIQQVINGATYPENLKMQVDLFAGMLRGMIEVGATGKILIADFSFYRLATNYAGGAVQRAAYQLNTMGGRAWLSNYLSAAVWKGGYRLFEIEGFTWKGTDGNAFPNATLPSDATWVTMTTDARNYSEGDTRFEYTGPGEGWPGGGAGIYQSAAVITGTQNAALTTPVSTALPSLTGPAGSGNPTVVRSGANITVSGRAAHLFGLYGVRVHRGSTWDPNNQETSLSGVCRMTFTPNGGNYTSNYDNAYQVLAYTSTDGVWAGETYAVLVAESIRNDVRYLTVTIT